jgi:hypothetical protein
MTEVEEYSHFIKSLCPHYPDFVKFHNQKKFKEKFGLKFVGIGVTRLVYKKLYSKEVIKVASKANLAEYALYRAFDNCKMQSLLAKCNEISKDGVVLTQEYLSKDIPDYLLGGTVDQGNAWTDFQTELESLFKFIKNFTKDKYTICDIHPGNIRVNKNWELKIIDYAAPLDTIVEQKKFDLEACIEKLSRYTRRHDQNVKFYLNHKKQPVLDLGTKLVKLHITNHLIA